MAPDPFSRSLDRYELLQELGRGSSGVVYKGRDPQLDRPVAIKAVSVPPGLSEAERAGFERRFFEEARRAAGLSHPGLVIVHDAGKDAAGGTLFVVFEYVEGATLAARLAEGPPLAWREAVRLAAQVARALGHAHAAGVVHRDLRPSNILVLPSGEPKVMDFGVARLETSRMTLTSIREAFGAPLYMSPEQAVGESVDARSDLFSLGAIAFRMLAGRDAFAAADPRAVLARVVYDEPPAVSSLARELPPGLDEVIARCLAKSRKDRHPDAATLAEDLEDLLADRPPRHASAMRAAAAAPAPAGLTSAGGSGRRVGGLRLQADRTALLRRSTVRGLAGVLALALVGVLELLRRRGASVPEAAVPPGPSDPPGARAPRQPPAPAAAPLADTGLPSLDDPDPAASARLSLEVSHTLKRGSLRVSVDDQPVVEQRLSATGSRSLLGLKFREGRVRHLLPVKPGRRRIRVEVRWDDSRRAKTIVGTFRPGATRRLSARLGRIAKGLALDWR